MATTEPLRNREHPEQVRSVLNSNRDRCRFTLGVNTAVRRGDLPSVNVGDGAGLKTGDELMRREQKTGKTRRVTLNPACVAALQMLERLDAGATKNSPLFVSAKRGNRLGICGLSRMWKMWCEQAALEGNFASHSGRKTFGYINRVQRKVPLGVLQRRTGMPQAQPPSRTYVCRTRT